jgi:hypothetical protein
MNASRRSRLTLAKIMGLNVVVAVILALSRMGLAELAEFANILAVAWGAFLTALLLNAALDLGVGVTCPTCQRKGLRRLALPLSTVRYYRCTTCSARWKRNWLFAPWRDASGATDEAVYRRKSNAGDWLGFFSPDPDNGTCGTLLRSKRERNPRAPLRTDVPTDGSQSAGDA